MNKNVRIFLLSTGLSLFILGCSEKTEPVAEEYSHDYSNLADKSAVSSLSLNNGERWEMDQHTRMMLLDMEKTFFDADHATKGGLNAVGVKLEAQLEKLIAGCTMEGESHNQLHLFLTDYIPTINDLSKAKDFKMAKSSAIKLKGQLTTYKNYFK